MSHKVLGRGKDVSEEVGCISNAAGAGLCTDNLSIYLYGA